MKNDGGPAFPIPCDPDHCTHMDCKGMSLRDYFAAKAMQGHLSNPSVTNHPEYDRQGLAVECYRIADAMISERNK